MKTKKVLVIFLALVLLISFSAWAQEQIQVPKQDPLQRIIELVVENNPILQSQRDLIKEIEKMPEPGAGFIDLEALEAESETEAAGIRTPLLSMTQLEQMRDKKLERRQTLENARQTYQSLKKNLLTELFSSIITLSKLENQEKSLNQLEHFLRNRAESMTQQVKAGLQQPATLFDLTERVMAISLQIQNTTEELEIMKLQIAITMGGDKWEELLILLNKL